MNNSNHAIQTKKELFLFENSIHSGDELEDVRHETDLKMIDEMFLGTTGLNIAFDKPGSVTEVFSAVFGDELIISATVRTLTVGKYHLNTEVIPYNCFRYENLVGLIILMGQVRSSNIKDYCPTDLHSMHARFLALSDNSQHTQYSGRLFNFSLFFNISFECSHQFTARKERSHCMKT